MVSKRLVSNQSSRRSIPESKALCVWTNLLTASLHYCLNVTATCYNENAVSVRGMIRSSLNGSLLRKFVAVETSQVLQHTTVSFSQQLNLNSRPSIRERFITSLHPGRSRLGSGIGTAAPQPLRHPEQRSRRFFESSPGPVQSISAHNRCKQPSHLPENAMSVHWWTCLKSERSSADSRRRCFWWVSTRSRPPPSPSSYLLELCTESQWCPGSSCGMLDLLRS